MCAFRSGRRLKLITKVFRPGPKRGARSWLDSLSLRELILFNGSPLLSICSDALFPSSMASRLLALPLPVRGRTQGPGRPFAAVLAAARAPLHFCASPSVNVLDFFLWEGLRLTTASAAASAAGLRFSTNLRLGIALASAAAFTGRSAALLLSAGCGFCSFSASSADGVTSTLASDFATALSDRPAARVGVAPETDAKAPEADLWKDRRLSFSSSLCSSSSSSSGLVSSTTRVPQSSSASKVGFGGSACDNSGGCTALPGAETLASVSDPSAAKPSPSEPTDARPAASHKARSSSGLQDEHEGAETCEAGSTTVEPRCRLAARSSMSCPELLTHDSRLFDLPASAEGGSPRFRVGPISPPVPPHGRILFGCTPPG
mmetsp:Transcript_97126/g.313051  ORF Transcript_97126/g.313051 Transcript_97126/m.313051 type:complete len:375 (-) Transcript_97126:552-1676(-)